MTRLKQKSSAAAATRAVEKKRASNQRPKPTTAARPATSIRSNPRKQRTAAKHTTKKAAISSLLRRSEGADIDELMKATDWLAHSVRATLTGLRKAGDEIVRSTDAHGASRYRIVAER